MPKCMTCGGDLISTGGGNAVCPYCDNVFSISGDKPMLSKSTGASSKSDNGVDVFEQNINSVLEIRWSDGRVVCSGSGFIIDKRGFAITNTHVVTREDGSSYGRVDVFCAGETVKASVLHLGDNLHGSGNGIDLAIIKLDRLPADAKKVRFAGFDTVKNGARVFVIGNSLGMGTCITSGIVSDRLRQVEKHQLLMTDCPVNGGNSGGPIFNDNGEVIGAIVSGISGAEGMNFAIPVDQILEYIDKHSGEVGL